MTRPSRTRQQGMTLLIALIMLVVITLFVVSMVRLGNTTSTIVSNMRAQKSVEAEAQQQVEIALNNFTFFDNVISNTTTWTATDATSSSTIVDTKGSYLSAADLWTTYKPSSATAATPPAAQSTDLRVYRPQCAYYETASGYSALSGVAPQDTYWDIKAIALDSKTSAASEVHQGIQMRLPPGNCS